MCACVHVPCNLRYSVDSNHSRMRRHWKQWNDMRKPSAASRTTSPRTSSSPMYGLVCCCRVLCAGFALIIVLLPPSFLFTHTHTHTHTHSLSLSLSRWSILSIILSYAHSHSHTHLVDDHRQRCAHPVRVLHGDAFDQECTQGASPRRSGGRSAERTPTTSVGHCRAAGRSLP
jgi:hypothetical protein